MSGKGKLNLWQAVSIAVGTIIGASIFSILGLGARICGSNLPIAFSLSALFSIAVGYSYAKLGSKYVSNAGPIEFLLRAFGDNPFTGTMSIMVWFSYVVSISLFAKAFAGYFLALFHIPLSPMSMAIVEVAVISVFTALNFFGARAVGRAEFWIVLIKLSILLLFVLLGIWTVNPSYLKPVLNSHHIVKTFFAASVLFLSYMGFGLITNASEDIEEPEKNVPRAIYISIAVVAFIYISVSVVALGNLGVEGLIRAEEYALAEAAKPFLGNAGFILISIGALFSISSAINATLYGGANVSYVYAKKGYLPAFMERKMWFDEPRGLYITAVLSLLFAIFLDLGEVSSVISFTFLILYVFVILAHYRLRDNVGGNGGIILFNFLLISGVFFTLMIYQWTSSRRSFYLSLLILLVAFLVEVVYNRTLRKRKLQTRQF